MPYDYYGEARQLGALMTSEGFAETARELEDTIEAGFTSTEIFMALRWHLDAFVKSKPDGSEALLQKAKALHDRLDQALRLD